MAAENNHHKWWGWGPEGRAYNMAGRPKFWPWVKRTLDLVGDDPTWHPVRRADVHVAAPRVHDAFLAEARERLAADQLSTDEDDRLGHTYGRSFRDLVRVRAGRITDPPDLVVFPRAHEDVEWLVQAATRHGVCLIPFGGGTNIVGALQARDRGSRMTVSVDLRRMNRLVSLDEASNLAVLEAGIFGPQLEKVLNERGFSLGHQPDSFEFCTLGGWIATRSAGTHSNAYGKIEDMVVALRVVTPKGTIQTRLTPATSSGPDVNRMLVGSEGTLGIITQATMRVHRVPEHEEYRLVLFPSFQAGHDALHECVQRDCIPSLARLSDEPESDLILHAKRAEQKGMVQHAIEAGVKKYLASAGYQTPAILVVGFEGPAAKAASLRKQVFAIFKKHRSFDLGTGAGEKWRETRYDVPYLRDYIMDYGVICDSLETATVWSNVLPMYRDVRTKLLAAMTEITGHKSYLGCHISHLYPTGACIYFTAAVRCSKVDDPDKIEQEYAAIKAAATGAIVAAGGTLSHHHAVGYEHQPWMTQEHSAAALETMRALKARLDPGNILNPGTLIPPA